MPTTITFKVPFSIVGTVLCQLQKLHILDSHSNWHVISKMSTRENKICAAIAAIKKGMSKKRAAKEYGVSRSTLQYRLSNKFKKPGKGPKCYLSDMEELLVKWIVDSARKGFPRRRLEVVESIQKLLEQQPERKTPFKNNKPGPGWMRAFLKRHPQIVDRKAENVTPASACVSKDNIKGWFSTIENYLKEENLYEILEDPSRIFNADETNFGLNATNPKVLAEKGQKNVYEIDIGQDKKAVTVMFSFSASGSIVPPMMVFPYKRLPRDILTSVPDSWGIGLSDSGWMTADTFVGYIKNVFLPFCQKSGLKFPVILFVDGHRSHLTLQASQLCSESNIILIALYPNATRILQPADVAAFAPIKSGWKKALIKWRFKNPTQPMTVKTVAPLLDMVLKHELKTSTLINGFKACGLYPWNSDAIDYSKCLSNQPSNSTTQHAATDTIYMSCVEFRKILGEQIFCHIANLNLFSGEPSSFECALQRLYLHFYPNVQNIDNENIEIIIEEPLPNLEDLFTGDMDESTDAGLNIFGPKKIDEAALKAALEKIEEEEKMTKDPTNLALNDSTPTESSFDVALEEIVQIPNIDSSASSSIEKSCDIFEDLSETPFQNILNWASTPKRKGKIVKTKMPFVVTSATWKEMFHKKEEEKNIKELEKQARKRKREEKKIQKEQKERIEKKKNNRKKRENNKNLQDENIPMEGKHVEEKELANKENIKKNVPKKRKNNEAKKSPNKKKINRSNK